MIRDDVKIIADEAYSSFAKNTTGIVDVEDYRTAVVEALSNALDEHSISAVDALIEWKEQIARDTDRRHTTRGKDIIRQVAQGQLPLVSLLDDVVLALGEGERVLFRYVDLDALRRADQTHYQQLRSSQIAFDDWRTGIWDVIAPVLQRTGLTLGEAIAQGFIS